MVLYPPRFEMDTHECTVRQQQHAAGNENQLPATTPCHWNCILRYGTELTPHISPVPETSVGNEERKRLLHRGHFHMVRYGESTQHCGAEYERSPLPAGHRAASTRLGSAGAPLVVLTLLGEAYHSPFLQLPALNLAKMQRMGLKGKNCFCVFRSCSPLCGQPGYEEEARSLATVLPSIASVCCNALIG